ncbi:unnamed protein product, partial [Polarella glacialis]
ARRGRMAPCLSLEEGKENEPPRQKMCENDPAQEKGFDLQKSASAAILEQADKLQRFQTWWSEGQGATGAEAHPMLSLVEAGLLSDIVAAGASYHNILSADRLDALQRVADQSSASGAALEALRRSLQTKGGAKSQARVVGNLLFKESMAVFDTAGSERSPSPKQAPTPVAAPTAASVPATPSSAAVLDEIFDPPRRYVCSESFPAEATIAVRAAPQQDSELLTSLAFGTEVLALGRQSNYLQFRLEDASFQGGFRLAFVPFALGDLELLVPSGPAKSRSPGRPVAVDNLCDTKQKEILVADSPHKPATTTEGAIAEQQDHLARFQRWWSEGQGATGAEAHPMLSLVEAGLLSDIVAAGASYHNILSADRLDALQRVADQSSASGAALEALRRSLQTKGGAKSQARVVGNLLFKESMAVFDTAGSERSPSPQQAPTPVAAPTAASAPATPSSAAVLDDIFHPPRSYVCSESFPAEATVAVRAAPQQDSEMLTTLPYGTQILANGQRGNFLQFRLEPAGQEAFVPRIIGDLVLFVPLRSTSPSSAPLGVLPGSDERVAVLEHRVDQQEKTIRALQAELVGLRTHMSAIASAFGALAPAASNS